MSEVLREAIDNLEKNLDKEEKTRVFERETIYRVMKEHKAELKDEIEEAEKRMGTQITQGFNGIKEQLEAATSFKDKILITLVSVLGAGMLGLFVFIVANLEKIFK